MTLILSGCVLAALFLAKEVISATEDDILQQISKTDPARRPVRNNSHSVQMSFSLVIVHLVELDEKQQSLTLDVWPRMEWINEMVQWDASVEQAPHRLVLPSSRVWTPDIYVQNSFSGTSDQTEVFLQQGRMLLLYSSGVTVYTPSFHLAVSCPVDTTYFPFDTQRCVIHLGSWSHSEDLLNISLGNPAVVQGTTVVGKEGSSNSQWQVVSVEAVKERVLYELDYGAFSELKFTMTLQRRPLYYVVHLTLPIILLHMLSLTTFLVPPEGGERMSVGLTTFLSFSVFSLVLMEHLPESSVSLPFISIYLSFALGQNLLITLWSVYTVRAWLRPPSGCFNLAAVPLPAISWLASVSKFGRADRKMCSCISQSGDVNDDQQEKGHLPVDNGREAKSPNPEQRANPVDSTATQYRQEDKSTAATCLWHSSLDTADRLLFLTALLFLVMCTIINTIALPCRQGYY